MISSNYQNLAGNGEFPKRKRETKEEDENSHNCMTDLKVNTKTDGQFFHKSANNKQMLLPQFLRSKDEEQQNRSYKDTNSRSDEWFMLPAPFTKAEEDSNNCNVSNYNETKVFQTTPIKAKVTPKLCTLDVKEAPMNTNLFNAPPLHLSRSMSMIQPLPNLEAFGRSRVPTTNVVLNNKLLPTVPGDFFEHDYIDHNTLANFLRTESSQTFHIFDMRYPYEFKVGAIIKAVNLFMAPSELKAFFKTMFFNADSISRAKNTIIIFHCEFSQQRAPEAVKLFKRIDASRNHKANTPENRYYPNVFILLGGYSEFFEDHIDLCDPPGYRKMLDDPEQLKQCRKLIPNTKSRPRIPSAKRVRSSTPCPPTTPTTISSLQTRNSMRKSSTFAPGMYPEKPNVCVEFKSYGYAKHIYDSNSMPLPGATSVSCQQKGLRNHKSSSGVFRSSQLPTNEFNTHFPQSSVSSRPFTSSTSASNGIENDETFTSILISPEFHPDYLAPKSPSASSLVSSFEKAFSSSFEIDNAQKETTPKIAQITTLTRTISNDKITRNESESAHTETNAWPIQRGQSNSVDSLGSPINTPSFSSVITLNTSAPICTGKNDELKESKNDDDSFDDTFVDIEEDDSADFLHKCNDEDFVNPQNEEIDESLQNTQPY